jgi:hypothetical protein
MKHVPNIAGLLLGLLFVFASLAMLLGFGPEQEPSPEGSYPALFMGAFGPSGYMKFIKILELIGGVLVAIPKTRGLGILILAPIVVNIFAFHWFIMEGEGMTEPMVLAAGVLTLVCLFAECKALKALMFK